MGKISIYHENGAILTQTRTSPPKLEEVQGWVRGYIEAVPGFSTDTMQAWCNEEGLVHGMKLNIRASIVCGQQLVGPVVFLQGRDVVLD